MRKIIILAISCYIAIIGTSITQAKQYNFPTNTHIISNEKQGVILIKPNTQYLVFEYTGGTAYQIGRETHASIVINAGYFGYYRNNRNIFIPAGYYNLHQSLNKKNNIPNEYCERDGNLCSFINTQALTIHTWNEKDNIRGPIINSGPILIRGGVINPDIYSHYSHRQRKTFRTILLNTEHGPLFLLTTKPYSLPQIAHLIKNSFPSSITAINLDGGSSTSIRTSQSGIYFNDHKKLPTYFVIR